MKSFDIHNGAVIEQLKEGCILGGSKARQIISAVTALLSWKVVSTKKQVGSIKIAPNGVILEIPTWGGSGGVGSDPQMMAVVSYHMDATNGDYLVCAGTDGSVNVAVEPQLQSGITSQTMSDASVWAYTVYTEATQKRTSTSGSTVLTEYISPPFLADDVVLVLSCQNTGVTVGGVPVTLIAITGRQWASA